MNSFNQRNYIVPKLYRGLKQQKRLGNDRSTRQRQMLFFSVLLSVLVVGITMRNYTLLGNMEFGPTLREERIRVFQADAMPWCERVKKAREAFNVASLSITYPCEQMKPAKSAIVCMLTDGTTEEKATRVVFAARDYINGALALGASLAGRIDKSQTHQLLLLREGFELGTDDLIRLEASGWHIGTAPNFPIETKYTPKFPRYKTTYTKVTAIGLSEYKCVLLMDADTLAVGDLKEVLKCDSVFQHPSNRVAGVIDWYRNGWKLFNTGSILWKTSSKELERLFNLTQDSSFMKRYSSDQDFLNNVYPDRLKNTTFNEEIVALDNIDSRSNRDIDSGKELNPVIPHIQAKAGAVVPLSWDYNAQTHSEVQNKKFWDDHRSTTRILHFTEKKGWQCEARYDPIPVERIPQNCKKKKKENLDPLCFCGEAHLYWTALMKAGKSFAMKSSKNSIPDAPSV